MLNYKFMSLSDKIDFFPIEHTTYQKTLPQLSKTVPSNFGWHADKYLPMIAQDFQCIELFLNFFKKLKGWSTSDQKMQKTSY